MKKNVVITEITLEKFGFFAGVGTYVLKTNSGDVTIVVTDKKSNFGTGDQTVYSAEWDGQSATDKPIVWYKRKFGAVINHRDGTAVATAKVLTDTEISEKVATFKSNVENTVTKVAKLLSFVGCVESETVSAILAVIPSDYVTLYRDALLANNQKARDAKDLADKVKREKEEKAEKRETAKQVMNLDSANASALAELIKSGVDLTALLASIKTA